MKETISTPPFSEDARVSAGYLLRQLQEGFSLALPHSRPMPAIGSGCHELRINDGGVSWRIIYRVYEDAILILDLFMKKSAQTPKSVIAICRQRIRQYESDAGGREI